MKTTSKQKQTMVETINKEIEFWNMVIRSEKLALKDSKGALKTRMKELKKWEAMEIINEY